MRESVERALSIKSGWVSRHQHLAVWRKLLQRIYLYFIIALRQNNSSESSVAHVAISIAQESELGQEIFLNEYDVEPKFKADLSLMRLYEFTKSWNFQQK